MVKTIVVRARNNAADANPLSRHNHKTESKSSSSSEVNQ